MVGADAVAAVDRLVGVEEEAGPGELLVELEELEVEAPALDDADADELLEERGELRVLAAGNLPVDRLAGRSGDAAEDDEERLSGALGRLESRGEVVVDPVPLHLGVLEGGPELVLVLGEREGEEQRGEDSHAFKLPRKRPKAAEI
jgi:hypothetical protein